MKKVTVKELLSGRYGQSGKRPLNWDERIAGIDTIETTEGEVLKLASSGQQSSPKPGWVLVIQNLAPQAAQNSEAVQWTLFGLPSGVDASV